jgi:hypothetical protein
MAGNFLIALAYIVGLIVIALVILWAVGEFFPEIAEPARIVVGGVILIGILYVGGRWLSGNPPRLG